MSTNLWSCQLIQRVQQLRHRCLRSEEVVTLQHRLHPSAVTLAANRWGAPGSSLHAEQDVQDSLQLKQTGLPIAGLLNGELS